MLLLTFVLIVSACSKEEASDHGTTFQIPNREDGSINDGLQLPEGFSATVVVDSLGPARHLTVRNNGDLYLALRYATEERGSIAALRDTTGDGRADIIAYFGEEGGTGIHMRGEYLYFAPTTQVLRYPLGQEALLPVGPPEVVVSGFAEINRHPSKPFEFDDQGWMYVSVGSPSNACQDPPYTPGAPGVDPCPQREQYAGIWRFRSNRLGQTKTDGYRYASGIRNGVANAWNPLTKKLYVASHGRGYLHRFWPDVYTEAQDVELPAEELFAVEEGSDFGWPYCYYDHFQGKKLLNPEYGGDGTAVGRCDAVDDPILAFPGHWAPNDLLFYMGRSVPRSLSWRTLYRPFMGRYPGNAQPHSGAFVSSLCRLKAKQWLETTRRLRMVSRGQTHSRSQPTYPIVRWVLPKAPMVPSLSATLSKDASGG